MNNIKALKSGLWYTVSNFAVKGIGILTTPIFTRILTKAEFGLFNNYTSWLSIMSILVTMHLESTLISARFDYEDRLDDYIFSVLSLSATIALVWMLIINIFKNAISSFTGVDPIYLNVMMVYLLFLPGVNFFQIKERYLFEYKKSVLISLILSVGTALLSVLLVVSLDNKLDGRIFGSVIPTVILGLWFYIFFYFKSKKIDLSCWKYALPISLPFIPHLLSMTVLNSMDKIMINKICGSEDAAVYGLAYTCGTMVTILLTSINGAFAPWLGVKLHENKIDEVRAFTKIYIFGFLFLAIGIMLVSPEVLFVLGGKPYLESIYVITPVAMGCVCQFLYTMFVNIEQYKKKTVGMAIASVLAAIVNYILNYIFIPRVGYLVAAYTTLAGYLCLLVMHMYLVYRLGYAKVYDYKIVAIAVLIGVVLMVMITYLYNYSIIRYIFVGLYMIIAIVFIKKYKYRIKAMFRKDKYV